MPGSEAADGESKAAVLHVALVFDQAVGNYVPALLHCFLLSSWQGTCTDTQGNKLRVVKSSVQTWQLSFSAVTPSEHSHVPNTWPFAACEPAPFCINCGITYPD
jgi:hypothetical protein